MRRTKTVVERHASIDRYPLLTPCTELHGLVPEVVCGEEGGEERDWEQTRTCGTFFLREKNPITADDLICKLVATCKISPR